MAKIDVSIDKVVDFTRVLRRAGVKCSTSEVIDAVVASSLFNFVMDEETARAVLKCTLLKNNGDEEVFDKLFDWFWLGREKPVFLSTRRSVVRVEIDKQARLDTTPRFIGMYSPIDVERRKRIREVVDDESLRTTRRIIKHLVRRLALAEGRRRGGSYEGEIDFQRTMRESLRTMGEVVKLRFRSRRKTRSKLVILLDVSGSMSDYWGDALNILLSLKRMPNGSYEVFTFSSRVQRVTEYVNLLQLNELVKLFSDPSSPWGGGTRIGESLEHILSRYQWVFDKRTVVLIVSDGWDLGDLKKLENALMVMRDRCGRVLWLTPHEAHASNPQIACLRVASRYVDGILPLSLLREPVVFRRLFKSIKGLTR